MKTNPQTKTKFTGKKTFAGLNKMAKVVYLNAVDHGFHSNSDTDLSFAKSCNNLHSEISELWEAWRNGQLNDRCNKSEKMLELGLESLTNAEEELADIIIRALDTARSLGIDVERAVLNKHNYNKTRPMRHGGKLA